MSYKELNFYKYLILAAAISFVCTSCSYDKTELTLGSAFDSTWQFNSGSNFDFNDNLVQFQNGKVSLKAIDLQNSSLDFNNGNYIGSFLTSSGLVKPSDRNNQQASVDQILPDHNSDLLAYWKFDQNLNDSSQNNVHLNSIGELNYNTSDVFRGTGVIENNGVLDPAVYNNTDGYFKQTEVKTISMWFKKNGDNGQATGYSIPFRLGSIWNSDTIQLRIDDGSPTNIKLQISRPSTTSNTGVTSSNFIVNNIWYHIVGVIRGSSQIDFYVNGNFEISQAITELPNDLPTPLRVGSSSNTSSSFNGLVDELALWKSELSSEDVKNLYNKQSAYFNELSPSWTPKKENLVGYWKMDGNWLDSSGNNNHGVPINNPSFVEGGKVGSHHMQTSVVFPGNGGHVSVGNDSSLNSTTVVTQMAWVKADSFAESGAIIRNGNTTDLQYSMYINGNTGRLQFHWYDGSFTSVYSTGRLTIGVWHHVAVVRDGSNNIHFYIDGEFDSTAAATQEIGGGGFTYIGTSPGVEQDFDGAIDELAVWNTDLSRSDIKLIYNRQKQKYASHYDSEIFDLGNATATWSDLSWATNLPFGKELVGDSNNDGSPESETASNYINLDGDLSNGLVAHWALNEGSWTGAPGEVIDNSGLNNHGDRSGAANTGAAKLNSGGVFKDLATGLDYLEIPNSPSLENVQESNYSISAWYKPDFIPQGGAGGDYDAYHGILIKPGTHEGLAYTYTSQFVCFHWGVGNIDQQVLSTSTFVPGKFYHISCQYDLSNGINRIYVNGVLEGELTFAPIASREYGTAPWRIGTALSGTVNFSWPAIGTIDEVAIWNRALSATEISQLYRRGANRIKLQVKSCIDATCNCKSYNVAPAGSATDCDGDGTPNETDTNDSHKSDFIGPGGDGTTFYSELFNKASSDVTFNCALNTTDSDAGVCVPDEITLTGSSKTTGPEFLNIDYSQFVTPPNNRYAQYRVFMEADDNNACSGKPCLPELSSVSFNPSNAVKYFSEYVEIKPKSPIYFTSIQDAKIAADACATFRLHRSPNNYYHDGSTWVLVSDESHRNIASEVTDNIQQFATQFGAGELEVIGYLKSDPSQSNQCSIDEIDINYK